MSKIDIPSKQKGSLFKQIEETSAFFEFSFFSACSIGFFQVGGCFWAKTFAAFCFGKKATTKIESWEPKGTPPMPPPPGNMALLRPN